MSRFSLWIFVAVLLLTGCWESPPPTDAERDEDKRQVRQEGWNVWSDTSAAPIAFEREQTYGTVEGSGPALLGNVRALAVDSAGTVYVLDGENHRLVAFNPDGTVRWSNGKQGAGPGEFRRPRDMILGDKGRLFVANNGGREIDVWTTNGTFVERQTFEANDLSSLSPIGYADGFLILSESGFGNEPQTIHAVDPETWDLVHSFPLTLKMDLPEMVSVSKNARTVGDSIVVSSFGEYILSTYSVDGTPGRRISRSVDVLVEPGIYRGARAYGGLGTPVRLPKGHLLIDLSWPTNVDDPDAHFRRSRTGSAEEVIYATALDLFDPSGRYAGSLRWNDRRTPPFGDLETVAPNGKLYTTTNDPYPQVRRYDVVLHSE